MRAIQCSRFGGLKPLASAVYSLADASRAIEDLRDRRTTGKVILRPVSS